LYASIFPPAQGRQKLPGSYAFLNTGVWHKIMNNHLYVEAVTFV